VTRPERHAFERVRFLDEAKGDMRALAHRSPPVLIEAFRLLKLLDLGKLAPTPLHDFSKTGDLSDCGKIVVAVVGEPEYRIVVRQVTEGVEVIDVIAVEDRTEDLPYLLAGLRLGRITDPARRSDVHRRLFRIRRHRQG
jgi:hypothetical protein